MPDSTVSDAEATYLTRIAEDCADLLGPEVALDGLDVHADHDVVLTLRYRLGRVRRTSEGRGTTVIAAHAALRQELVLDRVRLATSALYRSKW